MRCLPLSDLRRESALFELAFFLCLLRLIFPSGRRLSLLLGKPLEGIDVTCGALTLGAYLIRASLATLIVFGHLLGTVFSCEFVRFRAEHGLRFIDLLLRLNRLFELLLGLDTHALQLQSIGVE